jgi:hypothetical protein
MVRMRSRDFGWVPKWELRVGTEVGTSAGYRRLRWVTEVETSVGYRSGQTGQTVNLLAQPSEVRILPPPFWPVPDPGSPRFRGPE